MFPTPVGMNRQFSLTENALHNVPHTSGDEPMILDNLGIIVKCSPHQWG